MTSAIAKGNRPRLACRREDDELLSTILGEPHEKTHAVISLREAAEWGVLDLDEGAVLIATADVCSTLVVRHNPVLRRVLKRAPRGKRRTKRAPTAWVATQLDSRQVRTTDPGGVTMPQVLQRQIHFSSRLFVAFFLLTVLLLLFSSVAAAQPFGAWATFNLGSGKYIEVTNTADRNPPTALTIEAC